MSRAVSPGLTRALSPRHQDMVSLSVHHLSAGSRDPAGLSRTAPPWLEPAAMMGNEEQCGLAGRLQLRLTSTLTPPPLMSVPMWVPLLADCLASLAVA